ncbi:MAG: twin-arginine translocase subunit TatB [Moraxellaceae bacterium]|nr:twin-arginine translocase subunit TatB [Moraxellaceae bacterium]
MFDVGFSELILLGIVALVVLGPEKLPHAARMAGAWLGKIKRTVIDIQAEIEKEVSAAELKQRMNDEIEKLKALSEPIEAEIEVVKNTIHQQINDVSQTLDETNAKSLNSEQNTIAPQAEEALAEPNQQATSTVNLVKP